MMGDTEAATSRLSELADMLGHRNPGFLRSAGYLAAAGRREALRYLLDAIQSGEGIGDDGLLRSLVASTVQYYTSTDREAEGIEAIEGIIRKEAHDESKPDESRAYFANQLQMLYYGANRTDDALKTIQYVIELSPENSSYYFNKSLILEQLEELEDAVEAIEKCMEFQTDGDNERHLRQALDLYRKLGYFEKIEATESALRSLLSNIDSSVEREF